MHAATVERDATTQNKFMISNIVFLLVMSCENMTDLYAYKCSDIIYNPFITGILGRNRHGKSEPWTVVKHTYIAFYWSNTVQCTSIP